MALPILVRSLDIRLSRVHLYTTLFDRHLELHRHVRFVRVIDDFTRHWVKEDRSGSDTWVRGINRQWQRLSDLIKRRWTSARFDITSGVSSVNEVAEALECSQIEQNIVAMRWIADHPSMSSSVFFERARAHEFPAYEEVWETISYIIENVTNAQTASDIKLVSLQIRGHQSDPGRGDLIVASCVWQVLNELPSDYLHTLDITVGAHVPHEPHEGTVFGRIWSNLRHLNLKVDVNREHHIPWRAAGNELDFDSWILAHPRLEHVDIGPRRSMDWLSSETALPNLTTISLLECDADLIGAFLLRHGQKLVRLELAELTTDDDRKAAIRPGLLLPKLRMLLASSRVAIALLGSQHAPVLVQIEFIWASESADWMIEAWVRLESEATHRITCLDLNTYFQDLLLVMEELSRKDFSHSFSSLVELWLTGNVWHGYGRQEDPEDISVRYLQDVLQHLEALSCLRALRIWTASLYLLPFPVNDPLELSTGRAPRKLEYLTWNGSFTHAQTFRVVHQPIQYVARQTEDVQLPPILLRLQLLPASFLAHITDEAEWIEPGRDRWCKTIFDHTVSPPRLRPQAGLP
ncbi:hypothetical protein OC846_005447 [Tilletia horrida]|uniref:Uncharacterized protein n=1 Tax=Tilletia horrida TaxID=155126 RepID=A0AAN6JPW8_9BASI|nr:hypothetical protein OC846_005447 [Tilletia horrida]KAK0561051.1 hypothetical protein OC861_005999 [Tilletia horrida]